MNQTARIAKCDGGQVVTLNIANKTKITMKTTALGPKTFDGTATDGYQMLTQIATEREGKTSNVQIDGTTCFTALTEPRASCASASMGMNLMGPMAMMARWFFRSSAAT